MNSLIEYQELLQQIDAKIRTILSVYENEIACRKGCGQCCILESVFPVEAHCIRSYLKKLPQKELFALIRNRDSNSGRCVFLCEGSCFIYPARPAICRTHGYPILAEGNVDFCPKNLQSASEIKSECIFDLEKINKRLALINLRFVREKKDVYSGKERILLKDIFEFF